MSDTLQNQISAFVDGELPEHEAELLVRRLCNSQELRDVAARYSLIGHVMRGEQLRSSVLAERVMAQVAEEPPADRLSGQGLGHLARPLTGVAVAAVVAGVALIGLQAFGPNDPGLDKMVRTVAPATATVAQDQLSSELRRRLNVYQVSHYRYRPNYQQWGGLMHLQPTVEFTSVDGVEAQENQQKNQDSESE